MIEIVAAPVLMAAAFVLPLGHAAAVITFILGALLMAVAISGVTENRTIPLSAHAGFDYTIATLTIVTGIAAGVAGENPLATVFLVGFGVAHLALTGSTRFSARVA